MSKNVKILNELSSGKTSNWKKLVSHRRNNPWLLYSSEIATRVLAALEDLDMNQTDLATKMNVKKQQVSKIVSGDANLTLETIYKLSKALDGKQLVMFPDYKYSTPLMPELSSVTRENTMIIRESSKSFIVCELVNMFRIEITQSNHTLDLHYIDSDKVYRTT